MKKIEIWADSFHEGVWCCDNICKLLKEQGFDCKIDYVKGFIPHYEISKNDQKLLDIIVYGSYKSWNPLPETIANLINWGKPDFLAYDATNDKILFAAEETAATPTGNQAMQRCERQYGCAHLKIPYWYFVSEYGEHIDGGVRRDNIWPSIAAIKLTLINKVPCVVLHYSDIDNVEDYSSGNGLVWLFASLSLILVNFISNTDPYTDLEPLLAKQYQEMLDFISSQWRNVIDFLPSKDLLLDTNIPNSISRFALNKAHPNDEELRHKILVWPLTSEIPNTILQGQNEKELIKHDDLAELLEKDITSNKCYILSNNAGSGKPTTESKIAGWINEQEKLFNTRNKMGVSTSFNMHINDFPKTVNGNIHITTSKNIVYLYDKWSDLKLAIEKAYPRLIGQLNLIDDNTPVFLYISNSLKPGRLFGDPYTGQLSAYSTCFGKFDLHKRAVIVYAPHQVYTQMFDDDGDMVKNKGTTLYSELVDYIIFNSGVAVSLKNNEVL